MAKREFLQLAHPFKPDKHRIGGWWWSEKLDGMRAFWDGGVTRGMPKSEVPWANTDKDSRYVDIQVSSGLWSRYGNVIHAPDPWLDKLPRNVLLDGELYAGHKRHQSLMSIVKDIIPGPGWDDVSFMAFDSPPVAKIFENGVLNNTNYKKNFNQILESGLLDSVISIDYYSTIRSSYTHLRKYTENEVFMIHNQYTLPTQTDAANELARHMLERVTENDGEGLIIRNPDVVWLPERTHTMVKMKKLLDSEATVLGYISGRKGKEGRRLGMLGALIVQWNGLNFELSGFSDAEGAFDSLRSRRYAEQMPESLMPDWANCPHFPRGSKVTFMYRELSDKGVPKEARVWRVK